MTNLIALLECGKQKVCPINLPPLSKHSLWLVRQIQRIHLERQVSDIHQSCQTICGEHTFEIPQQKQLRYLLCLNNFGPVLNSIGLRGEQLGHVAVVDVVMGEVLHIVT